MAWWSSMIYGEKDRDLVGRTNVQIDHGYWEMMMIKRSSPAQHDVSSGAGFDGDCSVRWDTSNKRRGRCM